ncbi:hypothetical protein DUNSADRAFT_11519 [Dunaliella salina]|uniref:Encoded protein n=1 Tax=Dunaliella salina TaxID=3046 RepID=A0ABQ7H4G8_DUNSA|nr:hypothetical protein DUNSADRAFT_11519 [Dunaliella salina]|eukprot:KAF5841739.1 hypothetical protein DUNSADRAFT_11519 [Dunaliella salina]
MGEVLNIPRTDRPTPPSRPYVVRYSLDSFGANAEPVLRLVHVDCGQDERICEEENEEGGTEYNCSAEGLCIGLQLSVQGDDSGNRQRPTIKLKGKQEVEIDEGETYQKCSESKSRTDTPCERGVKAEDSVQGDLSGGVHVQCFYETLSGEKEDRARADPILFASADLSSCGLDTKELGTWHIVFKVTNNEGMPSDPESVTRKLRVAEECSDGMASCGSGLCAQDVVQCGDAGDSASEDLSPPSIQLRKVPGIPETSSFVPVPRFSTYKACPASEVEALLQAPCEPGASALSGDEDDLTSQVLACPPQECLDNLEACTMDLKFSVSGISGCEIDTSAEVGAVLPITLAVVDSYG